MLVSSIDGAAPFGHGNAMARAIGAGKTDKGFNWHRILSRYFKEKGSTVSTAFMDRKGQPAVHTGDFTGSGHRSGRGFQVL